ETSAEEVSQLEVAAIAFKVGADEAVVEIPGEAGRQRGERERRPRRVRRGIRRQIPLELKMADHAVEVVLPSRRVKARAPTGHREEAKGRRHEAVDAEPGAQGVGRALHRRVRIGDEPHRNIVDERSTWQEPPAAPRLYQ